MSFFEQKKVSIYNIKQKKGDYFELPILFPFDITDYEFELTLLTNVDGDIVLNFETSDFDIVAGDPESVQNSATLFVPDSVTSEWPLGCFYHKFRWWPAEGRGKTVLEGTFDIEI